MDKNGCNIMNHTYAIHTLGCKVNTYESDAICEALEERGFVKKDFSESADVYIINTCTVTNVADKKSRQMLHRARKKNPDALIVAAGCYVDAALQNDSMKSLLSDSSVDIFVSNKDKASIPELIEQRLGDRACGSFVAAPEPVAAEQGFGISRISGHTRAFMKIQDGCNQFCSYCIIPYVRGRIHTRPLEDIVEEARRLSDSGISEIVLSGIHLSSYGKDLLAGAPSEESGRENVSGCMSDDILSGPDAPLISVVRELDRIPGIRRIRLGSLEPRLMSEGFVRELSGIEKLCPSFHLSLQSGSDSVLRRMNRHYTTAEYEQSCGLLRKYFRDPAITTDIIVGFPGETEEEFCETESFMRRMGFYEANIFKYSRRAGTRADRMEGQVPEDIKTRRSERLIAIAEELSHDYREQFLGRRLEILTEEKVCIGGRQYISGYTREYLRCLMEAGDIGQNELISGTAKEIFIEKAMDEYIVLV